MDLSLALYILGVLGSVLAAAISETAWISIVVVLIVLPLGAIYDWRRQGRALGEIGFSRSRLWLRYLSIGFLVGLGIAFLFLLVQNVGGWLAVAPRAAPPSNELASMAPGLLRLILVVAIEEFVFRGFFPNVLGRKVGVWTAIVLSSLLWGASHIGSMVRDGLLPGEIAIAMASFLAWGIALSLAYLMAGKSLWVPFGLHLGTNFGFSMMGWFFIIKPNAPPWWIGHPAWWPESGWMGPLVWTVLALLAYWLTRSVQGSIGSAD